MSGLYEYAVQAEGIEKYISSDEDERIFVTSAIEDAMIFDCFQSALEYIQMLESENHQYLCDEDSDLPIGREQTSWTGKFSVKEFLGDY